MHSVPIHQAKTQLSALIAAVEQGEDVVLTRHGKRVARLVREPDALPPSIEARRQAIAAELQALRAKVGPRDAAKPDADRMRQAASACLEQRASGWTAPLSLSEAPRAGG
jgi:antitoxin (DNA-binding transcriptional repressor) of toxin-antitoxin stability system